MIESAITQIGLSLKEEISYKNSINVDIYTRILAQLVNSWIEVRLFKIINEEYAFTDREIRDILANKSLNEKWKCALTSSYLKAYNVKSSDKINDIRYSTLISLIASEILGSNQLRNKLAHGQWKYAFNGNVTSINQKMTNKILNENIMKLQIKMNIFRYISQIIHDLAISKPTFERDFNTYYNRIRENQQQYDNKDFAKWKKNLISKQEKGKNLKA